MPAARQNWDETDFTFQAETMPTTDTRNYTVAGGRVLDDPPRHRSVEVGKGQTKSIVICFHGRRITHPCSTCEYEAVHLP